MAPAIKVAHVKRDIEDSGARAVAELVILQVRSFLASLNPAQRVAAAGSIGRECEALRALALAELAGPDVKMARHQAALIDGGASGRRHRGRVATRAAVLAANPDLARAVSEGHISVGALDALSRSADDEDLSVPEDLTAAVIGLGPDQAQRMVTARLRAAATRAEIDDLHARQQDNRRARRGNTTAGDGTPMASLTLEGPKSEIDLWWARLEAIVNAEYHRAGGREAPDAGREPVSARIFDAAARLFSGDGAPGPGGLAKANVVITVPVDPTGTPDWPGHGPVPTSVLRDLIDDARIWSLITDLDHQPLWLGRARRHASVAQRIALAVRDRGCVLCGVAPERCHAHHLLPWEAPDRGTTDVPNLALACPSCHHDTHRRNHTMVPADSGRAGTPGRIRTWTTRPATPAETPPAKPP